MSRVLYAPNRPTTTTKPGTGNEIRDRWHMLEGLLGRLLQLELDQAAYEDEFNAAELLLQTLPLASGPFAVAMNRLLNARRYLQSREIGAARFELRLLGLALKKELAG
jgi:hypothetical protein